MLTNNNLFLLIVILLLFLVQAPVLAQTLVQDTLMISFNNFDTIESDVVIDTVIDERDEDPHVLGTYEKTRYLFVPVDLLIRTDNPLSREVTETVQMSGSNGNSLQFKLIIDEFNLTKKTNSMFYPRYLLHSSVQVYQNSDKNEPEYTGQLLYENTFRVRFFRDKLKRGFESVTHSWHRDLFSDLAELSSAVKEKRTPALDNFRIKRPEGRPVNMITGVDFLVGTQGWMTDGEIFFSHREAKKRFYRSGYNIRYRNADTFESIEFGLSNDYWFYRWRPDMIFRLKSQPLIGFNRWNDFETTGHKLWDAFIIDYSLSQSFIYNPLDKRSVIIGLGLMENIYYIYSRRVTFQCVLLINIGVKL